jgi:dTDP-4-amino-4,6-dideoxygalactose transaminase
MTDRLDTVQAAVLLSKLDVFDDESIRRHETTGRYDNALADAVVIPVVPPGYRSVYALYTIQVAARDGLMSRLKESGIGCAIYCPRPVHLHPAFTRFGFGAGSTPVAEGLSSRVLSLPMHADLRDEEVDAVCRAVLSLVS